MFADRYIPLLIVVTALSGCASDQKPATDSPATGPDEVLRQLVNTDNGLELLKWLVVDDSQTIGGALLRHAGGSPLEEEQNDRLRRNGFRFLRVPLDSLEALPADLGGTTLNLRAWHGQVYDWREVESAPVGPGGEAVAVDGRIRRFGRGRLMLLARSWTMPMEDGPRLYLQLRVGFRRPGGAALRQLLEQTPSDEFLPSLNLEICLETGYAYVLTCESPTISWDEPVGNEGKPNDAAAMTAASSTRARHSDRIGPGDGIGPEVAPPVTVGRRLLTPPQEQGRRAILLFVPRIPPSMYPSGDGTTDPAAETSGMP
ncbi:MAG: hypothetical protein JSV91_05820 [Phycisphaerales bacterium]|nr:MAG: hypothetical protein JSV91_05820 [Phycisphaerales bacterium]